MSIVEPPTEGVGTPPEPERFTENMRVRRHLVSVKPTNEYDTSTVLCIRMGDCRDGGTLSPDVRPTDGWALDKANVTCPKCLEWIHA